MKALGRILAFCLIVAVIGVATHYVLFRSPGMFVWQLVSGDSATAEVLVLKRSQRPDPSVAQAGITGDQANADLVAVAAGADTENPKKQAEKYPAGTAVALLNGKDLTDWESIQFGGEGDVFINEDGHLELGFGALMTGAKWTPEKTPGLSNYEIELDAMRLDGNDFFCGLTFPVKDSHATFIIGGWGGGLVGISSIDDLDASENETMNIEGFEDNKWYHIKLRVTDNKLEAWIGERQMVDVDITDSKISLRPGDIELCKPIGLACFAGVRAKYRNVTWKNLPAAQASDAAAN